ncbi:MAG: hypothetical protein ACE5KD_00610 [Candidatus Bathyarchaeia archaeon]
MGIGLMGIAGAFAYWIVSKEERTGIWNDIIFVGIILDCLVLILSLALTFVPMGISTASIFTTTPVTLSLPIPFWGIIMGFIWGYIEYLLGAIMIPLIDWLRRQIR